MSQATTAVRAAPRRATQPGAPVRPKRERLVGLDAMRAVAILGMIYMHVSPTGWLTPGAFADKPAVLAWIESVASGRAMSLFVLMAGISVALMTGGTTPVDGARLRTARWRLAIRAAGLFLISLVVDQLSGMSLSILMYYALWMLLVIPLLRLSPRALLVGAAVAAVVMPLLCFVLMSSGREWPISPFSGGAQPTVGLMLLLRPQEWLAGLKQLLVGGGFQTPYAIPLLLAGLAIGRLDLRDRGVRWRLAGSGVALVAVSSLVSWAALGPLGVAQALEQMFSGAGPLRMPWGSLFVLPPHQLYAMSVPMAPFMLGVGLLLLTSLLALLERPVWQRLLLPLTSMGKLALTWYASHLVFIERVAGEPPYAFSLFAGMCVFALAFSPLWLRWSSRGPLELLVHRATLLAARRGEGAERVGGAV